MTLTLRDFAESYELHPLWIGVLYELPIERTVTPGPAYNGPKPGTWTRAQRTAWLRLVEQCADMLYTVEDAPLQLPPPGPPVAEEGQPGDDTHAAEPVAADSAPTHTPDDTPGRPELASTQPAAEAVTASASSAAGEDRGASPPQAGRKGGRSPGFGWTVTHEKLDALPQTGTLSHAQLQAVRLRADGLLPAEIAERMSLSGRQAAQRLLTKAKAKLSAPMLDPPAGSSFSATSEVEKEEPPAPERLRAPLVRCPYCQEHRTQRHVDQHTQDVEKERQRQEDERAKIAHLVRTSGVGGAA